MKDNPEFSSLKVNRNLLDSKFEGYRLSNENVSISNCSLTNQIIDLSLEDKQLYSYLHYTAFSYNCNYLFNDPFSNQDICFFADCKFLIWLAKVNMNHELEKLKCVLNFITFLKDDSTRSPNDCLLTLSFFSSNKAILLFSRSTSEKNIGQELIFFIFNTGDRNNGEMWSIIQQINILNINELTTHLTKKEANYTFLTCPAKLLTCYQVESLLEVCILCVIKDENEKFITLLSWFTLNFDKSLNQDETLEKWKLSRLKQLQSNYYPHYIQIDESQSLSIISENIFQFTYDSNFGVISKHFKSIVKENNQVEEEETKNFYIYYQDDEKVNVYFKLPKECNDVNVTFNLNEMVIKVHQEIVLNEKLEQEINIQNSAWTMEQLKIEEQNKHNIIKVALGKKSAKFWPKVFKSLDKGFEIMDQSSKEVNRGLSLLNSDIVLALASKTRNIEPIYIPSLKGIEHCDSISQDLTFFRLNGDTKHITHQINLDGHQWLFTCNSNLKSLPAFVIRHDVDALIWQPEYDLKSNNFKINHINTFPALGYVQASKRSKKFINLSLDYNYAYIADVFNHIYLYQKPILDDSLRNRKLGAKFKFGKQQVINLNQTKQLILGCIAYKHHLLVLTSNHLFCVRLKF